MKRRLFALATALALPAIAVMAWMLTSAPHPSREDAPSESISLPRDRALGPQVVTHSSSANFAAYASPSLAPALVRRSDEDFPELAPTPAPVRVLSSPAPVAISPRFTLTTQPNAAALDRELVKNPNLPPNERIRVLPADVVAADPIAPMSPGSVVPAASKSQSAPGTGAIVLQIDRSLHDPAAWVQSEKPLGNTQEERKVKIADEFAAEVAAAAKAADQTLDDTWKDARARSNWEYQKFFGSEAANRAGINAGRAAVQK